MVLLVFMLISILQAINIEILFMEIYLSKYKININFS